MHDNVGKVSLMTVVQYCCTNADNPVTGNLVEVATKRAC